MSHWHCKDCRVDYRVELPGKRMVKEVCSDRVHGKTCGQPFYHCVTKNNKAKMVVWPCPEEPATEQDILVAARHLRDTWAMDQRVHYKQSFAAVTAVCKAVDAAESKT